MKKIIQLILLIAIFNAEIFAQSPTFSWAKQFQTGTGDEYGESITTDASGNVYTAGYFDGIPDFDPGAGSYTMSVFGNYDAYISKLDAAGNFVWAKQLGGTNYDQAYSIAVDAASNVYVTGSFRGTADFDPGPGSYTLSSFSPGAYDVFVCKLDVAGNFVWAVKVGSGFNDFANGIAVDASGNPHVTGYFEGSVDFDPGVGTSILSSGGGADPFILKLTSAGNFAWARNYSGSGNSDNGLSIAVDNSGNVVSSGIFNGTTDFDPGAGTYTLATAGVYDAYVAKLDASGNFLWAGQIGSTSNDYGNSLKTDNNGNVLVTGTFSGTVDFDPGPGNFNITGSAFADTYILKLNFAGNFVWAKVMGSTLDEKGLGITVDGAGNVFTTGYFMTNTDFNPGPGNFNMVPAGNIDGFVSKLSQGGTFLWAIQFGGAGSDCVPKSIDVDASNNIHVCGTFNGTVDFDGAAAVFNMNTVGDDAFITKYGPNCTTPASPSSIVGNTLVCAGAISNFSSTSVPGALYYVWNYPVGWSGTSNTFTLATIPSSNSGTISIVAANNCGASAPTIFSVTVDSPTITISPANPTICAGNSITLNGSGANTYTWVSGPQTPSISVAPTAPTIYTLTGTSTLGCVGSSTTIITVNALPFIFVSHSSPTLCAGQSGTLNAGGAVTYTWLPTGSGSVIVVSPSVTTSYTVTGTNANGCSNSLVFTQAVTICTGLNEANPVELQVSVYPNPFIDKITTISNVTKQNIQVFNSIGSLVYSSEIKDRKGETDLSNLASGIYYMKIGSTTIKLIKE